MQSIKSLIKSVLRRFNIGITTFDALQDLLRNVSDGQRAKEDLEFLAQLPDDKVGQVLGLLSDSKSQLRQDLFVLVELGFKSNGFFVEVGAANGVDTSNTYLLEKRFGWTGILAEPAKCWHDALKNNRSANIEAACVWRESNSILQFNEVDSPFYSTIGLFSELDHHKEKRREGKVYDVGTISLNDLLAKYRAPRRVDYLSIDTEGSEFEILSNVDFGQYSFEVITCEHNYSPMRDRIFDLLSGHGYVRKFEKVSRFDDWYVRRAPEES